MTTNRRKRRPSTNNILDFYGSVGASFGNKVIVIISKDNNNYLGVYTWIEMCKWIENKTNIPLYDGGVYPSFKTDNG